MSVLNPDKKTVSLRVDAEGRLVTAPADAAGFDPAGDFDTTGKWTFQPTIGNSIELSDKFAVTADNTAPGTAPDVLDVSYVGSNSPASTPNSVMQFSASWVDIAAGTSHVTAVDFATNDKLSDFYGLRFASATGLAYCGDVIFKGAGNAYEAQDLMTLQNYSNLGGVAGGHPILDGDLKISPANLPPGAIPAAFTVADTDAMIALTAQIGDIARITTGTDRGSYILSTNDPSTLANWLILPAPVLTDGEVDTAIGVPGNTTTFYRGDGSWSSTFTGSITATSFIGSGASLTALNATNLASGTVNTARLGSGSASSATTLLGNNTWAIPPGTLINVRVFTTGGTYTPTPGTNSVIVEAVGGGGGGGGAVTTNSSQGDIGAGGSSGRFARSRFTSSFSGVTLTIGAGGTGVSASNGNNGTSTSFGALLVCPGGSGGSHTGIIAVPNNAQTGLTAASPAATGANIFETSGDRPPPGLLLSSGATSGPGWSNPVGTGGDAVGVNGTPVNGSGYGSGGGGALTVNGAARAGGNGAPGVIIVYEYA